MHKYILLLFLIGVMGCENQPKETVKTSFSEASLEDLEKEGFELFQNSPSEAVAVFKKVAIGYEMMENTKKAGLTNLNIANIYDEYLNQLDSALIYSQKSLQIWQTDKDTLQMANLHKYIGLLKGKSGLFQEAKASINTAITLYTAVNFEEGKAVSEFNLADVYLREGNLQKSEAYFFSSKEFWISKEEKSRVFTNNLLGMKLYHKMEDAEKMKQLISENKAIEKEIEVYPFVKEQFEKLIKELK